LCLSIRGSHRERPSRSSFFGERNAADEQRFAEGTRELRSVRLLDVKKLTGSEDRARILVVRAVKGKSKRQIRQSILIERGSILIADQIIG